MKLLIDKELVDEIGRLLDIGMREGWQAPREMLRNLPEAKMLDLGEVVSRDIDHVCGTCGSRATIRTPQPASPVMVPTVDSQHRALVALLEAEVTSANRELQELGEWQYDHVAEFKRLSNELEALTKGRGGEGV